MKERIVAVELGSMENGRRILVEYSEYLKVKNNEKKEFGHTKYGTKRDYSVRTRVGGDGKLEAFFSSEYAGCGNGDYYILINPTTALYVETD